MKSLPEVPFRIRSVAQLHQVLDLPGPDHPLISVVDFTQINGPVGEATGKFTTDFYIITLKQPGGGTIRYGQHHYDFDQGMLSFIGPDQVLTWTAGDRFPPAGLMLVIHPDFLRYCSLGQTIKSYNFFRYSANEALFLSPKEEKKTEQLIRDLQTEYQSPIDAYSQDVILSQIDLVLHYANRFYNRQFITRKHTTHDLLTRVDQLLIDYVSSSRLAEEGLPTVGYLAGQLHMSPDYLSDSLKKTTGLSAQQHIH